MADAVSPAFCCPDHAVRCDRIELASFDWEKSGRGDRIRTYDLLVPNQALYQAKLHPETRRRARIFLWSVKPLATLSSGSPHFAR